jgi:hypothetical protein
MRTYVLSAGSTIGCTRRGSMHVRCPKCKNRTGFSPDEPDAHASCPSCGHVFPPTPELNIPSPDPELVVVGARDGALAENEAGARSRAGGSRGVPLGGVSAPGSLPYDPGFREAVTAGRMTARQAAERGDRMAWAGKLVKRYEISIEQALLLTDNKATLTEVVGSAAASNSEVAPAQPGRSSRSLVLVVAALVGLALAGVLLWRQLGAQDAGSVAIAAPVATAPSKPVAPEREIRRDESGHVTAVTAPTPQAVLEDFCQSMGDAVQREPIRIVPSGSDWLGFFRQGTAEYAILIRRDLMNGLYTTGDGARPLVPNPVVGAPSVN